MFTIHVTINALLLNVAIFTVGLRPIRSYREKVITIGVLDTVA